MFIEKTMHSNLISFYIVNVHDVKMLLTHFVDTGPLYLNSVLNFTKIIRKKKHLKVRNLIIPYLSYMY